MIEVKVPKDIANFKPKHMLNLTLREFVFGLAGLIIMMYFYVAGRYMYHWNMELTAPATWIIFGLGGLIILIGFFNWHNMPLERIILEIFIFFATPRKRKYHNNNDLMEVLNNETATTKAQRHYIKTKERANTNTKKSARNASLPIDSI